jgi:hypothetical protein
MASRQTDALDRINAITANFFFWQGLRWVPLGAALLVIALALAPGSLVPRSWGSPLLLASTAVALWTSTLIGRWYARSFGRVRGIPGQHARRTRTKWLVVYPALVIALLIDAILKPPVLISGIAFAAAIEAYRRSTGGGRLHYVIASGVFAVLTFAPTLGLAVPGKNALDLLVGMLGATYVIGGLLDHRELTRIFPSPDSAPGSMAGAGSSQ